MTGPTSQDACPAVHPDDPSIGALDRTSGGRSATTLPHDPTGWFAVATSAELRPGRVLPRRLCGRDVVVFRTRAGPACVADAHCPHLGAHLGHGGVVDGEVLRCPFHGFCFDRSGACKRTGYGTRPPPAARLRTWPVHEIDGVVLAWHDAAGRAPGWRVPALAWDRFSPLLFHRFSLSAHPQQTTENSVDIGHFSWVHGFRSVAVRSPLRLDGPRLRIGYAFEHPLGPLSRHLPLQVEIDVQVHGLGYSLVELRLPRLGVRARHLVLATPTGPGQMDLLVGMAVEALPLPLRLGGLAARLLQLPMMRMYRADVMQDFRIWRHQRTGGATALAAGDGPIGQYRRWARQFYGAQAPARHEHRR